MKRYRLLFFLLLCAICILAATACSRHSTYAITWQNENGTVLERTEYPEGELPQYGGNRPEKQDDRQYSYAFSGWDKEITNVSKDETYVARYDAVVKTYDVVWKDDDGSVLAAETLPYGSVPRYEGEIADTVDHQDKKTFSGWSPIVTEVTGDVEYTALYDETMAFPSVYITTNDAIGDDYVSCAISTQSVNAGYTFRNAAAQIKIRGNGTANLPKKPYRIKFDKKQTMFGLNDGLRAKSWVLLAEYTDRTMLKNATAFYLARKILEEDGYYVSDCMFVEVFLNGSYNGLYLLAEQQQINDGRVQAEKPSEKNPTIRTGYLVEMDNYALSEDEHFTLTYDPLKFYRSRNATTHLQTRYTVKSDIFSEEQSTFILNKIRNTWSVLYDAAYVDRSSSSASYYTVDENGDLVEDPTIRSAQEAIERVIDVRSLVDTWILQEICENIDIGWSSFYIRVDCGKNGNGLLTFEAPWDFDWALGQQGYIANGFYSVVNNKNAPNLYNPWLLVVCNQQWFFDLAANRWAELNAGGGIISDAVAWINRYYELGKDAFDRNFSLWSDALTYVQATHTSDEYADAETQEDAIAWLKTFLRHREVFLNYALRIKEE